MKDIKELKRKRDEARAAAAKAREYRKRMEWSGNVEKKSMLDRKAKLLDAIADSYDERLKRIESELTRAKNLLLSVTPKNTQLKKSIAKAVNTISHVLQKCK